MKVQVSGARIDIDGCTIVDGASLAIDPGEVVGLIGPNGSGKSTLLRGVFRALRPVAGSIHLGEEDVWQMSARQAALRAAVVVQESPAEFDFTVREIVTMGRTPHKRFFDTETDEDRQIVDDALRRTGSDHLENRVFATLSGGEKQKTLLAKALAQRTRILILDEPTNHLDIRAQLELLELVRELGVTTLTALHELNLAAAYCDRIYVLAGGKVVASGTPDEVLTASILAQVFGVSAHRSVHPTTSRLHLAFAPLDPGEHPAPERTPAVSSPTEREST